MLLDTDKRKYFEEFKKKFLYIVELYPIEVRCLFYPYGVLIRTEYENRDFNIDFDIPIPELVNNITESLKDLFPHFKNIRIEKTDYTPIEVKQLLKVNKKLSLFDISQMKKEIQIEDNYIILKVFSKKSQLLLEENNVSFLYNYDSDIKDLKKRISEIRELGDKELYKFIFLNCWLDKEYNLDFLINIKYSGKQLENFILLNQDKVKEKLVNVKSKGYYKWGRFNIFFQNKVDKKKVLMLLKKG